ncbi:autotransporter outer membrane beta-barrel domain-containing protein [Alcanivorax sediminis]|uniref:Autotransporter domain-containing protein n=1 Tax=Alcanivorax sediminis TaxID=2663008 RepID=A0A6N7LP14_9GAMM|nr:autotransporter outer membrane beta-barrel domain-containing protein [Alcanivorax sediminis]MQX51859.1 autotransporter domain-containing protein [Alcanivorax sediminis]
MSLFNRRHHGGESQAVRAEILCAFGAALAFLLLLPGAASAAADGADGTGHDGVTGGQGQDGGDGGLFDNGGNGGDGVSLVYTDAPAYEASTTTGIDADVTDLTSLAGINNGDQIRVTVDSFVTIFTINTGDRLIDLAATIDQIISPFEMSASVTDSMPGGDQLIIEGAQNFLDLEIVNATGSPLSSVGIHFDNLPGTLGNPYRPFSHGGDGGNGGAGMLLGDVSHIHAAATAGGDGGAGGSSDYYYGNGGHGGDGGAGVELTDGAASVTLAGGVAGPITYTGGNGGQGGDGGAEGIGGDGGNGGDGVLALNGGTLTVDSGAVVAGGDGGLGGGGGTAGSDGVGGYGIHGANLDVTLAGTVNPGANQPTAILFASGDNRLTLDSGYSLGGNVLANGSNDVLALGGDVDGSFFTNAVGSTFQGFEGFEKTGASTWTLTGGRPQDWWVREGTLQGSAYNLEGNILNDGHVLIDDFSAGDYAGRISGSGSVTWNVNSILLLTPQTYTGLTHLTSGTFSIRSADALAGDILIEAGAQIVADGGAAPVQYDGVISGDGGYSINGANVVWTGDHTGFTGMTSLRSGATLTLGTGGNTGTIVGDVAFGGTSPGTLEINRGNDYLYDGAISGEGNLIKNGAGNYILSADHSMTGNATVNAGGMFVNGAMNGVTFTVNNGGLLGGSGSLGSTTVLSGGTLTPGDGLGALTINDNLTLEQGSLLDFGFGAPSGDFSTPGSSDSVSVNGDLAINGSTLTLNDTGSFGPGLYRLFDYTGTLSESNGGLQLANPDPAYALQYLAGDKQINLINTVGTTLNFWNANGLASGTTQGGGDGTWTATNHVWTDATGSITGPMIPSPGFAIFAGDAGTVTVSDADGAVEAEGIQFASDGYVLTGDALNLTGTEGEIRVGDGSAASSNYVATIANNITATNGLVKTGEGTLALSGGPSQAQDWWVREGTMQGNIDNLGGNILNDAHVWIDGSNTYQGTISGSGSVTWNVGFIELNNAQTYSGLTHIRSGFIGIDSAVPFAGDILLEAGTQITTYAGTGSAQYDGVISGEGTFVQVGGNVTWTGDHTGFTGVTSLSQGAHLTLGTGGNTGTIVGDAVFGGTPGTLEINRGNDYFYDGVISGAGNLIKNGAGNYILSADHSMTGTATVNAGGMFVNGAMNGVAFTVNDGGLLGGSGSLGNTTVNAGGTLAPGNSIGTLNINGDLTFNSGSVLALEVDPASNSGDVINVTGEAFLAGSVLHVGNDGDYQPFSAYTFLNAAGGINGQFDGVTSNYAFLDPSLTYTTDSVSLALLRNDQSFAGVVLTDNQRAVANNVDGMASAHALYQQVVQMSETEAAEAFQTYSGDSLLAGLTAGQQLQQRFAIGMRQRGRNVGSHSGGGMEARLSRQLQALAAPSDAYAQAANSTPVAAQAAGDAQQRQRNGVWVQAQSSRFEEDRQDDVGNAAFTFRGDQLALGMDRQGEQWLLGMAAGSADGTLDYDDRQADGEGSSWFAGLYGRWSSMGAWFLRGDLSYGSSDVSQQRMVLGAPAESDSSVDALRVALESGWDLAWGENGLHPYVQVAMTRIERDSFSETGGGIAGLSVDDSELNSGEAWLGADLSRAFMIGNDWLIAQGGLAMVQPFGDTQTEQTARFAGAAQGFTVYGADEDATQLAANAGAEWFMTDDFSLWLGYRGRFGGDTESHGGLLSANLTW